MRSICQSCWAISFYANNYVSTVSKNASTVTATYGRSVVRYSRDSAASPVSRRLYLTASSSNSSVRPTTNQTTLARHGRPLAASCSRLGGHATHCRPTALAARPRRFVAQPVGSSVLATGAPAVWDSATVRQTSPPASCTPVLRTLPFQPRYCSGKTEVRELFIHVIIINGNDQRIVRFNRKGQTRQLCLSLLRIWRLSLQDFKATL